MITMAMLVHLEIFTPRPPSLNLREGGVRGIRSSSLSTWAKGGWGDKILKSFPSAPRGTGDKIYPGFPDRLRVLHGSRAESVSVEKEQTASKKLAVCIYAPSRFPAIAPAAGTAGMSPVENWGGKRYTRSPYILATYNIVSYIIV
jgi:hypothetical protein